MTNANDMLETAGVTAPKSKATKLATMLALFCKGRSLNRFEAELWHDHCLNTTISTLKNGYGIEFLNYWETVPCMGGRATVRVKRYSLLATPDNIKGANALLAYLERRA